MQTSQNYEVSKPAVSSKNGKHQQQQGWGEGKNVIFKLSQCIILSVQFPQDTYETHKETSKYGPHAGEKTSHRN